MDSKRINELTEIEMTDIGDTDFLLVDDSSEEISKKIKVNELIKGKENISNKIISSPLEDWDIATDEEYYSAKAVAKDIHDTAIMLGDHSNNVYADQQHITSEEKTYFADAANIISSHTGDTDSHINKGPDGTGVSIGDSNLDGNGIAIGDNANANTGIAIGNDSVGMRGIAIGNSAYTFDDNQIFKDNIQIGTGCNKKEKTVQFYNFQILDENGHIPEERLSNIMTINDEGKLVITLNGQSYTFTPDAE